MRKRRDKTASGQHPARHDRDEPAARPPPSSSGQEPASSSSSSARDRSSNANSKPRSRLGCWTCRTRKVKCDEQRPVCGDCKRLDKECDWGQRFKFDDSTESTVKKYANVTLSGNAVWDRTALRRPSSAAGSAPPYIDGLPLFTALTTDEDREQLAQHDVPGRYNVIFNPESFSKLPEYARPEDSHRGSIQSLQSGAASPVTTSSVIPLDSDTIVQTRFQDVASTISFAADRRESLPGHMLRLDISSTSPEQSMRTGPLSPNNNVWTDHDLISHYERVLSPILYPTSLHTHDRSMPDPIVELSIGYLPLRHAICAISLLSLFNAGKARWDDAPKRLKMATSSLGSYVHSGEMLLRDELLHAHFLLSAYDVFSSKLDNDVWAVHMCSLRRVGIERALNGTHVGPDDWHVLSMAWWLDIQSGLSGRVGHPLSVLSESMEDGKLPPYPHQRPDGRYSHQDPDDGLLPAMIHFCHEGMTMSSKVAHWASNFRNYLAANPQNEVTDGMREVVTQYQEEMFASWNDSYPPALPRDSFLAGAKLPRRVGAMCDTAYLIHAINVIYSSTCMYPGQMQHTPAHIGPEINKQCRIAVELASAILHTRRQARVPALFAVFLAGFASQDMAVKTAALGVLQYFEREHVGDAGPRGRARALLELVCEEQRLNLLRGKRWEDVDWLMVARENEISLENFAL